MAKTKVVNIPLTVQQAGEIEYALWKQTSVQNMVEAFVANYNNVGYDEAHLDLLIEKNTEIFASLHKLIIRLASEYTGEPVNVGRYNYLFSADTQILQVTLR